MQINNNADAVVLTRRQELHRLQRQTHKQKQELHRLQMQTHKQKQELHRLQIQANRQKQELYRFEMQTYKQTQELQQQARIYQAWIFNQFKIQKQIHKNRSSHYLFNRLLALLASYLCEEYQGEFNALRQRWHRSKIPKWRINIQSFLCVLNLRIIQLKSKI